MEKIKQEKSNKSIIKNAFERTKKTGNKKALIFAFLFVLVFIVLSLAIIYPFSLLVSVPFLLLPGIFSFMAINSIIDSDIEGEGTGFFFLFKTYFSKHFFGGFKELKCFLLSLTIAFIVGLLCAFFGVTYFEANDPELVVKLIQLYDVEELAQYEAIIESVFENNLWNDFVDITTILTSSFFIFSFINMTLFESIKFYFNLLSRKPIFVHDLNTIHNFTVNKNKKEIIGGYIKSTWFVSLLLIVGFVGGLFLCKYILDLTSLVCVFAALAIGFVFASPLIPYYFDATLIFYKSCSALYAKTFIDLSMETIRHMSPKPEDEEKMRKTLNEFLPSEDFENIEEDDANDDIEK